MSSILKMLALLVTLAVVALLAVVIYKKFDVVRAPIDKTLPKIEEKITDMARVTIEATKKDPPAPERPSVTQPFGPDPQGISTEARAERRTEGTSFPEKKPKRKPKVGTIDAEDSTITKEVYGEIQPPMKKGLPPNIIENEEKEGGKTFDHDRVDQIQRLYQEANKLLSSK